MTQANADNHESNKEAKLPRRDWILLPGLGLLTICLIGAVATAIARQVYTELPPFSQHGMEPYDPSDPRTGWRAIPNSVYWEKTYESQPVEYRINSCGHRADSECGSKQPGAYRIVMVGSSVAMGALVPEDKTIAALLPADLSRRTGRMIEVYNEGMITLQPQPLALRFNEVLTEKPDMILWLLTPLDINVDFDPPGLDGPNLPKRASFLEKAWFRAHVAFASKSIPDAVGFIWQEGLKQFADSATGTLLQHVLYESRNQYVKSFLMGDDVEAGFLKVEPDAECKRHLRQFDRNAAKIEERARTAGVPLVAVLVPNRAQAAMISMGEWPEGYDPYKLDAELRSIVTSHGGTYIDILPDFRNIPSPERHYFPVNGHPDQDGHAMISGLLSKELTGGAVPSLGAPSLQPVPLN